MRAGRMIGGLLLLLILPLTVSAEELQQSDLLLQRIQFSDTARVAGSAGIPFSIASPVLHTSFQATSFAPQTTSGRLKDLVPDSERPQTKGIGANSTWMKGQLTAEGEVANNATNDAGMSSRIDRRDDGATRMVRMALTGINGPVRYGITYRSAGKAFFNSPDQTVREMWAEYGLGIAKLRSSSGQTWNNVDLDPNRPRIQQNVNRIGLALVKPAWPEFSVTYARSELASSFTPSGLSQQRSQSNSMEAALAYTGLTWNARLSSSYILTNDAMRGAQNRRRLRRLSSRSTIPSIRLPSPPHSVTGWKRRVGRAQRFRPRRPPSHCSTNRVSGCWSVRQAAIRARSRTTD